MDTNTKEIDMARSRIKVLPHPDWRGCRCACAPGFCTGEPDDEGVTCRGCTERDCLTHPYGWRPEGKK